MTYERIAPSNWYAIRWAVLSRDQFACQYCGQYAPNVRLEVDHKVAVCEGGTDEMDNLVTACWACNQGKEGYRAHTRGRTAHGNRTQARARSGPMVVGPRGPTLLTKIIDFLELNGPTDIPTLAGALGQKRGGATIRVAMQRSPDLFSQDRSARPYRVMLRS